MQQGHNERHAAAAQASETQRHAYYGGVGGVHVYTHSSAVQQKAGMVFTQVVASCTDAGTSCTAPRAILDVDATNDVADDRLNWKRILRPPHLCWNSR